MEHNARAVFDGFLTIMGKHDRSLWLGQSVDTSILHAGYPDFARLPILTSVGCVIRRPRAIADKFDARLRERVGARSRLMVDSGGFVLMRNPAAGWDVDNVARLYENIDAEHLVSLDVPPGEDDDGPERNRKYELTIANLGKLVDRFGSRIVPVAHGTTPDELDRNCRRILEIFPSPGLVGIGGLVPTLQRCGSSSRSKNGPQRRIADSIACVRSHFPKADLHLFGVGSLHTVLGVIALGVNSVDSIGWRQAAGFGSVYIPGRHRRLLTHRARERPCRPFANEEDLELLASCKCPECRVRTVGEAWGSERLAAHFKPRAIHNIWVLYGEIAAYLLAKQEDRGTAFLEARLSDAWLAAYSEFKP